MDSTAEANLNVVAVLERIARALESISQSLDSWNNAAIKHDPGTDGHVEIFATTHQS